MAPTTPPGSTPRPYVPYTPPAAPSGATGPTLPPASVGTTTPWAPASGDSYARIPGTPGAPPIWATPGYLGGAGPSAPPAAPPAGPTAPAPAAGPLAPKDPSTATFARRVTEALGAKPEDVLAGNYHAQGPLTADQTTKLTGAAKDYLLDTPVDRLAPEAASAVRAELKKAGVDIGAGKSLKDLPAAVGGKIAENLAKDFGKDPAKTVALVAGGAAAVGGAVATGQKVTVPIGPVRVDARVALGEGGRPFTATAGARGTTTLPGGATFAGGGSATVSNRGLEGLEGSARLSGRVGGLPAYVGGSGSLVRDANGHFVPAGGLGVGISPFKGASLDAGVSGNGHEARANAGLTIVLP